MQDLIYTCIFDSPNEHALSSQNGERTCQVNVNWKVQMQNPSIVFSDYGLTDFNNYLRSEFDSLPDDVWIVCPIQINKKEMLGLDIQLGMSGKCKLGQLPHDAMFSELQQELGLHPLF